MIYVIIILGIIGSFFNEKDPPIIEPEEITTGLNRVTSIYSIPDSRLFVVEQSRNRFIVINQNGGRLDSLGRRGSGDYTFNSPISIDATNGMRIYISDPGNNRIQIFDRRLQFMGSLKVPDRQEVRSSFFSPGPLAVNNFDELFVYDNDTKSIVRFSSQGRFEGSIDLRIYDIELPITAIAAIGEYIFLGDENGIVHTLTSTGGYVGFTSVQSNVVDLFIKSGSVWVLTETEILQLDDGARITNVYKHNLGSAVTSLSLSPDFFFISTSNSIYRASRN